jgi:hypothetical protein
MDFSMTWQTQSHALVGGRGRSLFFISEELKYHLLKKIPLSENKFKINSKSFINLINEVRRLYNKGLIELNKNDRNIVESDLARKVLLENGQVVYLEIPIKDQNFLSEAEYQGRKVKLNKPFRTPDGPKKFSVYVKNDKGNVVKVNFGDPNLSIKRDDPKRRKSFRARHKCDQQKDKTTPAYWSCYQWRSNSPVQD